MTQALNIEKTDILNRMDELSIMIDYTGSHKSIPEIAESNGVTPAIVGEMAIRYGWARPPMPDIPMPDKKYLDGYATGVVESLEAIAAAVSQRQRKRVGRGIEKGNKLSEQLDTLIRRLEFEGDSLRISQFAKLLLDATSIYKSLVDTEKNNVALERLVYDLSDNTNGDAPRSAPVMVRIESVIEKINARRAQLEARDLATTH